MKEKSPIEKNAEIKQIDLLSSVLRLIDNSLQENNWKTELVE